MKDNTALYEVKIENMLLLKVEITYSLDKNETFLFTEIMKTLHRNHFTF